MGEDKYDKINDLSCLFGAAASSGGCEAHCGFEGVVDPPLKTSEGSDHDDSGDQTSPKSLEADFSIDPSDFGSERSFLASFGVKFRDHGVSRVRDDGTEDTSEVA